MVSREAVEVSLEEYSFSFYVLQIPEEVVETKLAQISSGTGLISRVEYQNYLFSECIINLERLFRFLLETADQDQELLFELRCLAEGLVYTVNPSLNPTGLVVGGDGVIKPVSKGKGRPLAENNDWNTVVYEDGSYTVDEDDINPEDILPYPPLSDSWPELPAVTGSSGTVKRLWKRINVMLSIREFIKSDIPAIFGKTTKLDDEFQYKTHIFRACVVDAEDLSHLIDALELSDDISASTLVNELYTLCIDVNPFLVYGEVDLSTLKKDTTTPKKAKKAGAKTATKKQKEKRQFSSVSNKDLLTLADRIKRKVIGQDDAIDQVVDTIQIASCGLRDPEKPIAAYLLCGPTGIGKTYISKILAEELCGGRENMVRIDCSEYTQPHDVQKLFGSPVGYVGHEQGGFLTNAVLENPFSVVLFDEVEKAHSKFFDLLLQVLDDARLTDGKGNVVNFKDCVILLTSNVGVNETQAIKRTTGFGDAALVTSDKRGDALKRALKRRFRPEFLNRVDATINFDGLSHDSAVVIVGLMLKTVSGYLTDRAIKVEFSDSTKDMLVEKGFSKRFGARSLQRTIDQQVVRPLAKLLIEAGAEDGSTIIVDFVDGELTVKPKEA